MCMPPSKRINSSATVTTCSTVSTGTCASAGNRSLAAAATSRNSAGAGIRRRRLTRFDSTAIRTTADTIVSTRNGSIPSTTPQS